jgi:hypothetical protein
MREYREQKQTSKSFQTPVQSAECKQRKKQYIREYREQKQASKSFQPPVQSTEFKERKFCYFGHCTLNN